MPSIYPESLDTDLEIPRVDKNVSEISADTINSLRDAIFAIQRAVGLNVQGNKPSLADRLNVSIDADGKIKKSALDAVGLVTLPITNVHVGTNAGIIESKLRLDYSTQSLKNSIESLKVDFGSISSGLASNGVSLNSHILGLSNFHDGYHIKINNPNTTQVGVAGLEAQTIGDALNEIAQILLSGNGISIPHIDTGLPTTIKHRANELSVDTSNFDFIDRASTTIQEALDSIDDASGALGVAHLGEFHSNGILKNIKSGDFFNTEQKILGPISGVSYEEGTSIIKIPGVVSFRDIGVLPGDILQISTNTVSDYGTYQIRTVGPVEDGYSLGGLPTLAVDEISIFHLFIDTISPSNLVSINIYKPASVSTEAAPLACSVRPNSTIVDTISVLQPNSARVVSLGFNGSILNSDGYQISVKVGIGEGNFRTITIPSLHLNRLGTDQADPVSSRSVAERINAYVSHPDFGNHFPITAFRVGDEIAIAHNWVGSEYTIEILENFTGNFPLGLDAYGSNVVGLSVKGNQSNNYVVNGRSLNSIRTVFDGYSTISASTSTLMLWYQDGQPANPYKLGIRPGSVIHISGHPTLDSNGSYTVFASTSTSVSTFAVEPISAPTNPTSFTVRVTDADVPLTVLDNVETDRGIVQLYINERGETQLHQRLRYGTNLGAAVEIIDLSQNFPIGDSVINISLSGNTISFTMLNDSLSGPTVNIQNEFRGTFKLYHPNNIDFVVVKILPGPISGAVDIISIEPSLVLDESLELCNLHFNGTLSITSVIDRRLFGNLGTNQVRDDFIEVFAQRPNQELRSNGVYRGFDLLDIPYTDSVTNMLALPLRGGIAYVNGVRVVVETQKVIIPSFDEQGSLLTSARRVICINEFGTIKSFSDELGEILSDGYSSDAIFGKVLPLYHVNIVNGGIDSVVDVRLFINSLDAKLDLIVDETNNVVGNFRSLEGALLYAQKYPHSEKLTIRVINPIHPAGTLIVPEGVSIVGFAPFGGNSKHQIINDNTLGENFITLSGNNTLENIEIISSTTDLYGSLVYVNGNNVTINNCLLGFADGVSIESSDIAIEIASAVAKDVQIINNRIISAFSGVTSLGGVEGLVIDSNEIKNITGTINQSTAIRLGNSERTVDNIRVTNNLISIPSVVSSADIRGIWVDLENEIKALRISNNTILHDAENTMTNGIRVENSVGNSAKVKHLFVSQNIIKGIKLDDNEVFGIFINNVDEAIISDNKLQKIGVDGHPIQGTIGKNFGVNAIDIGASVSIANIYNNTITDCDLSVGINVETTGRTTIQNNFIKGIGVNAWYVSGSTDSTHALISGNNLLGPGKQGVRWKGTRSKLCGNMLTKPNDGSLTDYAFSEYGFYLQASDMDVENNTITGMEYSQLSIGISNVSVSRDRMKIVGNTIAGNKMARLIQVYGSSHIICDNRLYNYNKADSVDSFYLELNGVSNSLISGNIFQGEGTTCITSVGTIASNLTIINNDTFGVSFSGNTPFGSIILSDNTGSNVTGCLVANNRFPGESPASNVIGLGSPTLGVYNTNIIGINVGVSDIISIPYNAGLSSFDPSASSEAANPHWVIADSNKYWSVNTYASSDARKLYFPIIGPPNGSKLVGVRVYGLYNSTGGSTLTAQVFKKSSKSAGFPANALSTSQSLAFTTFGQPGGSGDFQLSSEETVNYAESSYYIEVTSSGVITEGIGDLIQVHGALVSFKY